jgi:hypothetical protein
LYYNQLWFGASVDRLTELKCVEQDLAAAEIRFNTIKISLDGIEREIDILTTLEIQLEQNLLYLRKKKIIALALEFRKAKEDLNKTKDRLKFLRIGREEHRRAYRDADINVKILRVRYAKLLRVPEENVVHGKFGRKDGR